MTDDTNVNVNINATDKTSSATESASRGFGGLWKSVAGGVITADLVYQAFDKLEEGIKGTFETFTTVQNLQNQISQELKNTHDVSGQTTESIEKYATQLSNTTPISKEAALTGDQVLLKYDQIGKDIFPQAQKAVADMAETMAHGGVVSTDQMSQAAQKLGVALDDPAAGMGRLRQAGVVLTAAQKEQIKTTEKANGVGAAQKLLLQDISASAGAAANAHQTLGNQIEILKQRFENLSEAGIGATIKWFQSLEPDIIKVGQFIANTLRPAIDDVYKAFKNNLIPTIDAHKKGLEELLKAIGVVIAVGFVLLVEAIKIAINIFAFLVQAISAAINIISDIIHWIMDAVNAVRNFANAIAGSISTVINWFYNLRNNVIGAVGDFGGLLYDAGRNLIQGLINGIRNMVGAAVSAARGVGSAVVSGIKGLLGIHSPSTVFAEIGNNMGAGLIQGLNKIQPQASLAVNQLVTASPLISSNGTPTTNNNTTHNTTYGSSSQTVNIAQVSLGSSDAVKEFFTSINQDTLNVSRGLAPVQGAY